MGFVFSLNKRARLMEQHPPADLFLGERGQTGTKRTDSGTLWFDQNAASLLNFTCLSDQRTDANLDNFTLFTRRGRLFSQHIDSTSTMMIESAFMASLEG